MAGKSKSQYVSIHFCIKDPRVSINPYLTHAGKKFRGLFKH